MIARHTSRGYLKGWIFWGVFLAMYFAYKFFPVTALGIFCGVSESNFQHYKASFFAWIITSLLEYIYLRRRIGDLQAFFFSRITTATILPWFVFLLWYIGPALYGQMPSIPLEILYANLITILVGMFGTIFEKGISRISWPRDLKIISLILAFVSLMHYIVFTFVKLPWADVFIEPNWR